MPINVLPKSITLNIKAEWKLIPYDSSSGRIFHDTRRCWLPLMSMATRPWLFSSDLSSADDSWVQSKKRKESKMTLKQHFGIRCV